MDELTIADQKYLSSKKAAKVTGYAKDYIGQLCREGRVEARLVGRNWYVLETSLMEHRFGPALEQEEKLVVTSSITRVLEEKQWISPTYTSEKPQELEVIKEKPVYFEETTLSSPIPASPLTDMQSAWQEWFEKEKSMPKTLPDASEMLLPVGEEEEMAHNLPEENVQVVPTRQEAVERPPINRITHTVSELNETYEPVSIRRKQETPIYIGNQDIVPIRRRELIRPETPVTPRRAERYTRSSTQVVIKRPNNSRFLVQVIIFAVVGLFIAGTVLSVTSSTKSDMGSGKPLLNFLNGVSTVQK